jgi:transposase
VPWGSPDCRRLLARPHRRLRALGHARAPSRERAGEKRRSAAREAWYQCCCGVDIPQARVVACLLRPGPGEPPRQEVRPFGPMTRALFALVDWLVGAGGEAVAMERRGSYGKPLYNLWEGPLPTVLVVNAAHRKQVPGRKTAVKEAEWIADRLRPGLLRASFIPERPQREWRELPRARTALLRARAAAGNRVQQVLAGATSKLAAGASDRMGVSAREMLAALLAAQVDAAALAHCARGALRAQIPQLEAAVEGPSGPQQRFLVAEQLAHRAYLDALLARVRAEIVAPVSPFAGEAVLVAGATGLGRRTAAALIAEIGVDMSRCPDADHLTRWAGLAPGSNERAGTRQRGKTRTGSPWLRATLIEAAPAAGRSKDT